MFVTLRAKMGQFKDATEQEIPFENYFKEVSSIIELLKSVVNS
jgi:hypothetical protein